MCSTIKGRLTEDIVFVHGTCAGTINTKNMQTIGFLKCSGGSLEVVDSLWYLGDQVSSGGGSSESVLAKIRTG